MIIRKKIRVGKRYIEAVLIKLSSKNLILFRARKGYIMCGYLDLNVADKFNDIAVKITGVSSITQAMKARVHSCSLAARKIGVYEGQPIKEVFSLIS